MHTSRVVNRLIAFVFLVAASVADAQTPSDGPGKATMTAADVQQTVPSFVREQLARRKIAGAVVVLVKDGDRKSTRLNSSH